MNNPSLSPITYNAFFPVYLTITRSTYFIQLDIIKERETLLGNNINYTTQQKAVKLLILIQYNLSVALIQIF